MTNAIATTETAAAAWTPEQVNTIRNTVAKGATQDELSMYLHLASTYGLDPFAKEIWFIKMDRNSPTIFTSRDGYLKIANNNPHFRGMVSDVRYENDHFQKTPDGRVEHTYAAKDRGAIVGGYALVFRDDRDVPMYCYAPFRDYCKNNQTWRTYPHAMIQKVAEAMTLKRAFSISGMVTREELDMEEPAPAPTQKRQQRPKVDLTQTTPQNQKEVLYQGYLEVCGGNKEHAKNAMLKITEGRGSKEWTDEDLIALGFDLVKRREMINAALDDETGEGFWADTPEKLEEFNTKEEAVTDAEIVADEAGQPQGAVPAADDTAVENTPDLPLSDVNGNS